MEGKWEASVECEFTWLSRLSRTSGGVQLGGPGVRREWGKTCAWIYGLREDARRPGRLKSRSEWVGIGKGTVEEREEGCRWTSASERRGMPSLLMSLVFLVSLR